MKKLAFAAALSAASFAAVSGHAQSVPIDPEPVVIVEDTSPVSVGILLPILALILVAAVAASD